MIFGRKAKNRRLTRESVLEVKMRSRDARRARWRTIAGILGAVGGTALAVLVAWQSYLWILRHAFFENEAYTLRRIEVRHEGRLRPDQISRWIGIGPGRNLMKLDLDRIRRDLEMNPWIQRAEVEARRPDCLRLSVWEREPKAQIVTWRIHPVDHHAWAETNYVDEAGYVLSPLTPDWLKPGESGDFSHLPRLIGIDHRELVPGQRLSHPGVESALQLIQAYEDSTMYSLVDLDRIDVSARAGLQGSLREGTKLVFGRAEFERQMRRWRVIHDFANAQGRSLAWLDLSVSNNLPASWLPATNAPAPLRPPKPQRSPKRHV